MDASKREKKGLCLVLRDYLKFKRQLLESRKRKRFTKKDKEKLLYYLDTELQLTYMIVDLEKTETEISFDQIVA